MIKAAKTLNIQIKHINTHNIQSSDAKIEDFEMAPRHEKGLDFNESKILADVHKQTRYPIGNFSKSLIKVSEVESTDVISNENINSLQDNL